jgi:hypothetical protein
MSAFPAKKKIFVHFLQVKGLLRPNAEVVAYHFDSVPGMLANIPGSF